MFGRRHHGDLPDGAALDHREHMASWSVHFACVVVHAESSVLEVLMREQDFLRLSKEQPGLAEAQDDCPPLVGAETQTPVSSRRASRASSRDGRACIEHTC